MYLNDISLIHRGALCVYRTPVISKEYAVILGGCLYDLKLFMR